MELQNFFLSRCISVFNWFNLNTQVVFPLLTVFAYLVRSAGGLVGCLNCFTCRLDLMNSDEGMHLDVTIQFWLKSALILMAKVHLDQQRNL